MAATLTPAQKVALNTWTGALPARARNAWGGGAVPANNLQALLQAYTALPGNQGYKPPNGLAPNVGGFAPFVPPTMPPPGTYDPSLDAQLGAANRGYGDLQSQTGVDNQRAQDDFNLQSGHLHDLLNNNLADLLTGRNRTHDAYEQGLANLDHNYAQLGDQQLQQTNAMGGLEGGALQQALAKRMANEARDRQPMDTAEQQSAVDYGTNVDRANAGYNYDVGNLGLGLSRGNEDRANTLGIAGRENAQFGKDIGAQRWFQATQAGYDPPQKPADLQINSQGRQSRLVKTPRGTRRLVSTGYLLHA